MAERLAREGAAVVVNWKPLYCPLCKAEYRAGFRLCSDCFAGLVSTNEEADKAQVNLLWQGSRVSKLDGIVATLRYADIPNYSRSSADSGSSPTLFRTSVRGELTDP